MGAVLVVAGLVLLNWAGMGSYVSTAWHKVRGNAKRQVPLEFEIDRLRHEVSQLVPDMKKNLSVIAEEIVAVENLKEEVATTETNLKQRESEIKAMTRDVQAGTERVVYNGREYSGTRVAEKLSRDFASFKRCKAELESKKKLLDAKERALEVAREQLAGMRSQKQELEVQVAQLEAELKTVRLAQTKDKFHLDDSKLSQCKATLAEIKNRLKVEQTETELHGEFANDLGVPVEKKTKSAKELSKEISAYFDGSAEESKVAGK